MTLDEIRAELVEQRAEWADKEQFARVNFDICAAKIEAHDRAVAAMPTLPNGEAKPERAPRRDLAELVRDALLDEPQTLFEIADKAGVFPSRALPALKRLMREDAALQNADGRWARFPR